RGTAAEGMEPAAARRLVQAYATWQVMRGLRASAAAAGRPRTPTAHARNNIRAAAGLLAWLRGRGTELAACGQADIDQWLRTGPSACLARDFLAWAASRGPCQRLSIPTPPRATGGRAPAAGPRGWPPAGKPTSPGGCAPGHRHAWPGISWPGPPRAATASG